MSCFNVSRILDAFYISKSDFSLRVKEEPRHTYPRPAASLEAWYAENPVDDVSILFRRHAIVSIADPSSMARHNKLDRTGAAAWYWGIQRLPRTVSVTRLEGGNGRADKTYRSVVH